MKLKRRLSIVHPSYWNLKHRKILQINDYWCKSRSRPWLPYKNSGQDPSLSVAGVNPGQDPWWPDINPNHDYRLLV